MDHHLRVSQAGRLGRILPAGIRARLLLLIGLTLLPVLLLIGWTYYQRYQTNRQTTLRAELEVAQGVAATFNAFINDIRRQSYAVGQAILTFEPYTQEKADRLLTTTVKQYPSVRSLNWASPEGIVLATSFPSLRGTDLVVREYFRQIQAGSPWALSNLFERGLDVNAPTLVLATAIRDEAGTLRGVVVIALEPTRLGELVLTQQRPANSAYAIFDRQGVLVYRSPEETFSWEERARWPETDSVLRRTLATGKPAVGITRLAPVGGEWVSARVPIGGTGWVAGAGRPTSIALGPLRRDLAEDIALALLVFTLAFVLATLLADTIAGPLRRLEQDAERAESGVIDATGEPGAPYEVRRLRTAVAGMAAGLVRRAEALREQEATLRQMLDSLPGLVWTANAEGTAGTLSPQWAAYTGQPDMVLQGELGLDAMHPEDRQRFYEAWQKAVAAQQLFETEYRLRRHDGEYHWFKARGVPIRDAAGNVVRWFGISIDVQDLKEAQEALGESARRYRELAEALEIERNTLEAAFENMELGVGIANPQGTILSLNRAAKNSAWAASFRQTPASPEDYTNDWELRTLDGKTLPPEEWPLARAVRGEYVRDFEAYLRHRESGQEWVYSYNAAPVRDSAGNVVLLIFTLQDITERKHAEEEIRALNTELEQRVRERTLELEHANKELEAFSYSVSHDLRAPLRSIDGFSKVLLERYAGSLDERGQDYLTRVRAAAQRMAQLIEDILGLSRAMRAEMRRTTVNLSALGEEVLGELRQVDPQRQVEVEIAPEMVANGDENLLRIVLQNLLGNAWKFTSHREVARIQFDSSTQDGERVYCIRDNGAGFDPAYADKLFTPFQRLHTEAEFPGTGIGLALVQRIIRRHGGRVWAEGAVDQGATFCFTLGENR